MKCNMNTIFFFEFSQRCTKIHQEENVVHFFSSITWFSEGIVYPRQYTKTSLESHYQEKSFSLFICSFIHYGSSNLLCFVKRVDSFLQPDCVLLIFTPWLVWNLNRVWLVLCHLFCGGFISSEIAKFCANSTTHLKKVLTTAWSWSV